MSTYDEILAKLQEAFAPEEPVSKVMRQGQKLTHAQVMRIAEQENVPTQLRMPWEVKVATHNSARLTELLKAEQDFEHLNMSIRQLRDHEVLYTDGNGATKTGILRRDRSLGYWTICDRRGHETDAFLAKTIQSIRMDGNKPHITHKPNG